MSAYRGRTGPNYTEFLSNLNSTAHTEEDPFSAEGLDLHSLDMFTNANFTNQDMIQDDTFNFEMNNDGNMKYEDLLASEPNQPAFGPPTLGNSPADAQFYSNYNTPIQPAPAHGFPLLEGQSPVAQSGAGARRKADSMGAESPEERSRVAAEEDKRRRNTAASARFRVKKKQREQALEKNVKEVSDKNSKLEAKLNQLEMENKWLKDLITEKNVAPVQSREELEIKFMEFKRESEERDGEHTSGVGTD